ncbi:hypothetical protein ACFWUU_23875 [Kribbella sp. NPDC058693]|uniref:hypothetical protein n=1 Tax=Kribbella sp. NPDC058693 TaxID=3346602 RepID=UPI003663A721
MDTDEDFVRLAEALRSRVRMYVPDDRFTTLVAFVDGVNTGTDGRLLRGFNEWLQQSLLGHVTNLHWSAVIRSHVLGVDLGERTDGTVNANFDRDASQQLSASLLEFLRHRSEN